MHEILYHTADVRLRVSASTLEELFADAMRGLFAVMHGQLAGDAVQRRIVVDDSPNTTALLVDFLNDVLQRAQIAREMFHEAQITIDGHSLVANLSGNAPSEFEEDVKAVTYHEADVRYENGTWSTHLVLDI